MQPKTVTPAVVPARTPTSVPTGGAQFERHLQRAEARHGASPTARRSATPAVQDSGADRLPAVAAVRPLRVIDSDRLPELGTKSVDLVADAALDAANVRDREPPPDAGEFDRQAARTLTRSNAVAAPVHSVDRVTGVDADAERDRRRRWLADILDTLAPAGMVDLRRDGARLVVEVQIARPGAALCLQLVPGAHRAARLQVRGISAEAMVHDAPLQELLQRLRRHCDPLTVDV